MHADKLLTYGSVTPWGLLVRRLISLADDTDRSGLRTEAKMILAMAYSVLNGHETSDCNDD